MLKCLLWVGGGIAVLVGAAWVIISCTDYCLWHLFHRHVGLVAELVFGVVASEILLPLTVIVWLLVAMGVLS